VYTGGELTLTYDSGKANCHGQFTRKTIITFICDYSQTGAGNGPEFLEEKEASKGCIVVVVF
jgi:hypothetical protein